MSQRILTMSCSIYSHYARFFRRHWVKLICVVVWLIVISFFSSCQSLKRSHQTDDSVSRRTEGASRRTNGTQEMNQTNSDWVTRRQALLSEPSHRHKVLLFCYMRGGSTYFSELFRHNAQAAYWYEPFDAFYRDLFGMKEWHLPQNVFWYEESDNRTYLRDLDPWEHQELVRFSSSLFRCDFDSVEPDVLRHVNVRKSTVGRLCHKLAGDPSILTDHPAIQLCGLNNIAASLRRGCPEQILSAKVLIEGKQRHLLDPAYRVLRVLPQTAPEFKDLASVVIGSKLRSALCYPRLRHYCDTRRVIAMKALRLTMDTVEYMLDRDPDLHILYLTRDPRAIIASRLNINHTYGHTVVQEARYLCDKMRADLYRLQSVLLNYPTAVQVIRYEDLVRNETAVVDRVYRQIGLVPHHSVYSWLHKQKQARKRPESHFDTFRANAQGLVDKWKMTLPDKHRVTEQCLEVLMYFNYSTSVL